MTKAFCPGHITCFFHPVRTDDPVTTGSRGVGLRLSLGTYVTMEERSDSRLSIVMDGTESDAPITRSVMEQICPGRGFDITVENQLPVGQGFGMSASGAIAAALCACLFMGIDQENAYRYAHIAEVLQGGGLGDVSAIMSNARMPVRIRPGLPPYGEVIESNQKSQTFTLAVVGGKLSTAPVISDPDMQRRMNEIGSRMVDDYASDPTMERMYLRSREFSSSLGIESAEVSSALKVLGKESGMCMLGHSIFTSRSGDEVREILGDVPVFSASTSNAPAFIQKA